MKTFFNKGFTVVELAVVIAVVAILSSVVVVGYQRIASDGDNAKSLAEYNDIRNAIELFDARRGVFPVCPSTAECNISEITSQLGVDGLQTMGENGSPIRYISTNVSPKSWAIRMYSTQTNSSCKMGHNVRSNWWASHSYCWQ